MTLHRRRILPLISLVACTAVLFSCGGNASTASEAAPAASAVAAQPQTPSAPPAASTGGFDGQAAYQYVADLVAIGSRTAGTDGNHRAQQYIIGKLQSFGCMVDQEDFTTPTPIGTVAMKNIVAKVLGASPDVVIFATHYDTKREVQPQLPTFVGADDGGSSTGIMLELARLICQRKNALTIWIAFLDGEEAFNFEWQDPDNTYGSRELAARTALSGQLSHVKAFVLADMVGYSGLRIKRESESTSWLTDIVWSTAARLGYQDIFLSASTAVDDDHQAFLHRNVPAVDLIDMEIPYWHTPQDTLDKISPRSLAVVGHVLIETLPALERRFTKN